MLARALMVDDETIMTDFFDRLKSSDENASMEAVAFLQKSFNEKAKVDRKIITRVIKGLASVNNITRQNHAIAFQVMLSTFYTGKCDEALDIFMRTITPTLFSEKGGLSKNEQTLLQIAKVVGYTIWADVFLVNYVAIRSESLELSLEKILQDLSNLAVAPKSFLKQPILELQLRLINRINSDKVIRAIKPCMQRLDIDSLTLFLKMFSLKSNLCEFKAFEKIDTISKIVMKTFQLCPSESIPRMHPVWQLLVKSVDECHILDFFWAKFNESFETQKIECQFFRLSIFLIILHHVDASKILSLNLLDISHQISTWLGSSKPSKYEFHETSANCVDFIVSHWKSCDILRYIKILVAAGAANLYRKLIPHLLDCDKIDLIIDLMQSGCSRDTVESVYTAGRTGSLDVT